jgi:hypothetical protein
MSRVAYALAGALVAAFAAEPVWADSISSDLSVSVTVVAPGSLAGTGATSAQPDRTTSQQPATAPPAQDPATPAQ